MVPTHSPLPQPPLVLANWTFHQTATSLLLHWTLVLCSEYIMYDVQCIADVCRSNDGIPLSSCGHWQVAHKWRVKVKARATKSPLFAQYHTNLFHFRTNPTYFIFCCELQQWQHSHFPVVDSEIKWRVKVKARAPCLQSTTPTYCAYFVFCCELG